MVARCLHWYFIAWTLQVAFLSLKQGWLPTSDDHCLCQCHFLLSRTFLSNLLYFIVEIGCLRIAVTTRRDCFLITVYVWLLEAACQCILVFLQCTFYPYTVCAVLRDSGNNLIHVCIGASREMPEKKSEKWNFHRYIFFNRAYVKLLR